MGVDLKPINPSPTAPQKYGEPQWGRYNLSGWNYLINWLHQKDCTTEGFSYYNDGDVIPESTCLAVADTIENHIIELNEKDQEWLRPHIKLWRTCGGYEQL